MPVYGTLIAMTLARLAFGYQLQAVASLGPQLIASFGLSLAGLGTLIGIFLLPGVAASFPYGLAARRFGDRWVAIGGLLLLTAGALLSAAATGTTVLGIGRMVSGAGAVAITVLQGKVVADRFEGPRFATAMGLVVGAFPAGIALAQLTQGRLAQAFGWPAAFLAGAAIAAASLVLMATTWRDAGVVPARRLAWPSRRECLLVLLSGLVWTLYNAGYFNFLAYMPTYLAVHGYSAGQADAVLSAATWPTAPSILIGGAAAARFGQRPVFLFGAVLSAGAVLGMYLFNMPLLWGAIFGAFASCHASVMLALGAFSTRAENRAVGMALFYTLYYAGGFLVPPLCGHVAELLGDPSGAFLCAGALSACAIPLYFVHRAVDLSGRARG